MLHVVMVSISLSAVVSSLNGETTVGPFSSLAVSVVGRRMVAGGSTVSVDSAGGDV